MMCDQALLISAATYYAGSKAELAKAVGCARESIYSWAENRREMKLSNIVKIKNYIKSNQHKRVG